ncbi:MAG: hypothetical protein ACYCOO_10555 [Chitinophagaceae bacterium]
MVKKTFFKLIAIEHLENSIQAILEIEKDNEIFKGHFPGRPIIPGACMLQMVKEVLANAFGDSIRLKKADSIKFIKVLNPYNNSKLKLTITYHSLDSNLLHVIAKINSEGGDCFKFLGFFILE